jgi:preprotein translocase subunit YajC
MDVGVVVGNGGAVGKVCKIREPAVAVACGAETVTGVAVFIVGLFVANRAPVGEGLTAVSVGFV